MTSVIIRREGHFVCTKREDKKEEITQAVKWICLKQTVWSVLRI